MEIINGDSFEAQLLALKTATELIKKVKEKYYPYVDDVRSAVRELGDNSVDERVRVEAFKFLQLAKVVNDDE